MRLSDDISQDVEATTMRHSHNDRVGTQFNRSVNLNTRIEESKQAQSTLIIKRITNAFIPGIRDSHPSNPNLFSLGYLVETNLSK